MLIASELHSSDPNLVFLDGSLRVISLEIFIDCHSFCDAGQNSSALHFTLGPTNWVSRSRYIVFEALGYQCFFFRS